MDQPADAQTLPDLLAYADYRRFLSDWFDARKRQSATFSHRAFSKLIGTSDPGFLVNLIAHRRDLPPARVKRVADALGLDDDHRRYFSLLVRFNQAANRDLRDAAWSELRALRATLGAQILQRDQFEVLSRWTYAAVAELIVCRGFKDDPEWIATRLAMSTADASEALAALARAGIIERDGQVWRRSQSVVLTTPNVQRLAIYGTYRDMYQKAGASLFQVLDSDDPAVSAETAILGGVFALPEEKIAEVRKMLWEMQTKVLAYSEEQEPDANRVMYMFVQMFPLSSRTDAP